jgi:hypothetical protein
MRKTEITLVFYRRTVSSSFFLLSRGIFLSVGWAGLLLTYFVWLGRTYRGKPPWHTRGLLNYTEQPLLYKFVCAA